MKVSLLALVIIRPLVYLALRIGLLKSLKILSEKTSRKISAKISATIFLFDEKFKRAILNCHSNTQIINETFHIASQKNY